MLYREIIAVCSQIHTKHINALCEQTLELEYIDHRAVHIVTTGGTYSTHLALNLKGYVNREYSQRLPLLYTQNRLLTDRDNLPPCGTSDCTLPHLSMQPN
jgi:hypothetical protein